MNISSCLSQCPLFNVSLIVWRYRHHCVYHIVSELFVCGSPYCKQAGGAQGFALFLISLQPKPSRVLVIADTQDKGWSKHIVCLNKKIYSFKGTSPLILPILVPSETSHTQRQGCGSNWILAVWHWVCSLLGLAWIWVWMMDLHKREDPPWMWVWCDTNQ